MSTAGLPSQEDVERLLADPSADARRSLAEKLGRGYSDLRFSERERQIADDIVRAVARDIESEVRQALSASIARSPDLPRDVARQLANDIAAVAEPVLSHSDVLADEDLVEVVRQRSEAHRLAVASRSHLAAPVAGALAEEGEEPVLERLVENDGAEIGAGAFERILSRTEALSSMASRAAQRVQLPLQTAERLILLVSDRLRSRGADIDGHAQDAAALRLGTRDAEKSDIIALIGRLQESGRLTTSLVRRAAEESDWDLMVAAAAALSGRPRHEVKTELDDPERSRRMFLACGQGDAMADKLAAAWKKHRAAAKP